MRAGTWDGAATDDNVIVRVNGTPRPVKKVTITSGMRDGHPAAPTSTWCVESTIEWAGPDDVTVGAPQPWTDSWLPKTGDTVTIHTGEGSTGQWWQQHVGVIDNTTGSIREGTATSKTVDNIEELAAKVSWAPQLATMPPISNASSLWRRQGLQAMFYVDRMLRNYQSTVTGWCATPPPTWQTIGGCTGQGSLAADFVGTLWEAHKWGDESAGPAWISTPYGVAPCTYEAWYTLDTDTGYSRSQVIASASVPRVVNIDPSLNYWRMTVLDSGGTNGIRVWHRADTDLIYWQTTDSAHSGNLPAVDPVTGRRAERLALYFNRASGATLRLDDGRESIKSFSIFPGWAAELVHIECPRMGGWWMVEAEKPAGQRWATLEHVPTARLRQKHYIWWRAARGLQWVPPEDFLSEQLTAECSAMWLDEDGVMQWAGRDVLDEQAVAQVVTTDLDVDEIEWEARRHSLAKNVFVDYADAQVRAHLGGYRVDAWEDGSSDLAPGEQDELTITIPDDEDWVNASLSTRLMSASTTPADLREGSWHGGTIYLDESGEGGQGWAIGITVGLVRLALRSWKMTVASWSSNPSNMRIKTVIPEMPGGNLSKMHSGKPALKVRCKALIKWVAGQRSRGAGSRGLGRFIHDVSWRVQTIGALGGSSDTIGQLMDWLAGVVGDTSPTVTGLVLAHDPRRQIGDKIRVQDRHVTGLQFEALVQDRVTVIAPGEPLTDTISGRTVAASEVPNLPLHVPLDDTPTTPPSDWTREVAP